MGIQWGKICPHQLETKEDNEWPVEFVMCARVELCAHVLCTACIAS